MATATDLFGAYHTNIGGIINAAEAEITFTDDDGNPKELCALDVSFVYAHEPQIEMMPGGKVLLIVQPAMGALSIGALAGTDLQAFFTKYGDPCTVSGNSLTVEMAGDIACDTEQYPSSPDLEETLKAHGSVTLTLSDVWAYSLGMQNSVKGLLLKTNVKIWVLNAELGYPYSGATA